MAMRVQKYGGSSVATIKQINSIAEHVSALVKAGDSVIVVVSAMGDTTDDLAQLALQLSPSPNRRELDMLLSTGERVTMALLSIALNAKGCSAISFTGSQAGILTDSSHTNARITDLKPVRVQKELETGSVVVLAGFQGVNPITKEITTLGRGGSDSTAVAMAGHFKASACEIMKDVDGVFSADPRLVPEAHHIDHISYDHLLEMTYWGSQVLHFRSVEMAKRLQVPILIAKSHDSSGRSTKITADGRPSEKSSTEKMGRPRPLSLNSHKEVLLLQWHPTQAPTGTEIFLSTVKDQMIQHNLPLPDFLITNEREIFLTGPSELLTSVRAVLHSQKHFVVSESSLSSVAMTYLEPTTQAQAREIEELLATAGVHPKACLARNCSVGVIVSEAARIQSLQRLHEWFFI